MWLSWMQKTADHEHLKHFVGDGGIRAGHGIIDPLPQSGHVDEARDLLQRAPDVQADGVAGLLVFGLERGGPTRRAQFPS